MNSSQIKIVEHERGEKLKAAPEGTVILLNPENWQGIKVEFQKISGWEMPRHTIEEHRLAINLGKPINYEWKNGGIWKNKVFQTGSFALQTHQDTNEPRWNEEFELLAVAFSPEYVLNFYGENLRNKHFEFIEQRGVVDQMVAGFAQQFKQELEDAPFHSSIFPDALKVQFLMYLCANYSNAKDTLTYPRGKLDALRLRRSIEFIHDHYQQEINLEKIAAEVYLSPFHFARLFKQTLGVSPHQFLLNIKIDRAKSLIAKTSQSLTEIGYQIGFYDQSHFVHAFKKVVGCLPKQFAKSFR